MINLRATLQCEHSAPELKGPVDRCERVSTLMQLTCRISFATHPNEMFIPTRLAVLFFGCPSFSLRFFVLRDGF